MNWNTLNQPNAGRLVWNYQPALRKKFHCWLDVHQVYQTLVLISKGWSSESLTPRGSKRGSRQRCGDAGRIGANLCSHLKNIPVFPAIGLKWFLCGWPELLEERIQNKACPWRQRARKLWFTCNYLVESIPLLTDTGRGSLSTLVKPVTHPGGGYAQG